MFYDFKREIINHDSVDIFTHSYISVGSDEFA